MSAFFKKIFLNKKFWPCSAWILSFCCIFNAEVVTIISEFLSLCVRLWQPHESCKSGMIKTTCLRVQFWQNHSDFVSPDTKKSMNNKKKKICKFLPLMPLITSSLLLLSRFEGTHTSKRRNNDTASATSASKCGCLPLGRSLPLVLLQPADKGVGFRECGIEGGACSCALD